MKTVRVVACGALARELKAVQALNGWTHLQLVCLPASLHNRPEQIADAVKQALDQARAEGCEQLFVAYADCGTAGALDRVLERYEVERLPGAHCYAAFAGVEQLAQWQEAEPGTFYLTDFLVRHFQRLVLKELGIEAHPELAALYFGQYKRVLYLAQQFDADLLDRAEQAAAQLGLQFDWVLTGYGALNSALIPLMEAIEWRN